MDLLRDTYRSCLLARPNASVNAVSHIFPQSRVGSSTFVVVVVVFHLL